MSAAFRLSDFAGATAGIVALNARVLPGMSPRDHAAWAMNVLSHQLGPALVEAEREGGALAALRPGSVHLAPHLAEAGHLSFGIGLAPLPDGRSGPADAAHALAALFAPAVDALAHAGPLAPRALWRIAGDGLAWGWARRGEEPRAREVLGRPGVPFANPQMRLGDGTVARRGGCCRYLSVSETACANCPLRRVAA